MDDRMNAALSYIRENLYFPGTHLLYDAAVDNLRNLPTAEEAESCFPNPCGYGTDMEDSMIHGGTLCEGLLTLYEKTGKREYADFALDLLEGLLRCAESARDPGFIPRSLCPDGVSHYPDSSRDQYTLFAFACLRMFLSPVTPESMKRRIRTALVNVANRAERLITPENGFDLPREDGLPSLVSAMWGGKMGNHEIFRLPMLYLAAWKVSGNGHFLFLYKQYRAEAYRRCLPMTNYWHLYAVQQMQASLWVAAQVDPEEAWREKFAALMKTVAEYALTQSEQVRQKLAAYKDVNFPYTPYRRLFRKERIGFPEKEKRYYSPQHEGIDSFWLLQDAANIVLVCGLAGVKPTTEALSLFNSAFSSIDLTRYTRAVPVHFLAAYTHLL